MSTIPCDFCPHPVDRAQMEEIEISHYVPDSSGDDLAYARTYFFGHPDCVRKFYRGLVDHKLDLFKHIPTSAPRARSERRQNGKLDQRSAPVAQLDSASPSEGEGCPFEPGREHDFSSDVAGMRDALTLALRATTGGDVPIGALLLVDGRRFEGWNEKEARPDPTAHAEMIAIAAAASALGRWRIGGTLYVTKEPCPMCAGAIAAARIERLVFGCYDPKGGAAGSVVDIFGSDAVNHRVEVRGGVLAEETAEQLRAFFAAKRRLERWSSG